MTTDKNSPMRQDRFSLLESVPITGTLVDYAIRDFDGLTFTVIPTPGHTTGSITLLLELNGERLAFMGDLIAAPGKVWSRPKRSCPRQGGETMRTIISARFRAKRARLQLFGTLPPMAGSTCAAGIRPSSRQAAVAPECAAENVGT